MTTGGQQHLAIHEPADTECLVSTGMGEHRSASLVQRPSSCIKTLGPVLACHTVAYGLAENSVAL